MSLILSRSIPRGLEVKTHGVHILQNKVLLRGGNVKDGYVDCEIPFLDFLEMVEYVLTNTDLYRNDPRLRFLEMVKKLKPVKGYNPDGKRLGTSS